MFKDNDINTRTTSYWRCLVFLLLTLNTFHIFSSVTIADFEQIDVCWIVSANAFWKIYKICPKFLSFYVLFLIHYVLLLHTISLVSSFLKSGKKCKKREISTKWIDFEFISHLFLVSFEIILFTYCSGFRFVGPHSIVRHFTMTQNYAAFWLNTVHRFTLQLTPITRHQHTNVHN